MCFRSSRGIDDDIAGMATMSALLHHAFGHLWTGFYRVVQPELLRVGPYQGSLGCLDIAFGRGVCGTAAAERRTIVVPDVDRFPGHITCDARSKSEIVVPVFDASGALIAVLDIDSDASRRVRPAGCRGPGAHRALVRRRGSRLTRIGARYSLVSCP